MASVTYQPWPELPYEEFAPMGHFMHMIAQVLGKLKLATPFEPQWANVPLWVTSRGLTTGPIPNREGTFTIDVDLIDHAVTVAASWGVTGGFELKPCSVADAFRRIMAALKETGVEAAIDPMPQEIANPIRFDQRGSPGWTRSGRPAAGTAPNSGGASRPTASGAACASSRNGRHGADGLRRPRTASRGNAHRRG